MKAKLLAWFRYVSDALAFRWMVWRRFRAWRDRPREVSRHRQRMEQWVQRNRFTPVGKVEKQKSAAADTRDVTEFHRNSLNK